MEVTKLLHKSHPLRPITKRFSISGYGSESLNAVINGPSSGARGPFTPSQWMELEYQILIFKYLSASVLVPTELLTPLKRPFYFYPCGSSGGFYRPDLLGWGTLCRMGYMGSPLDFEPGRCRGTDGKKWQCSRDVVGDQKYNERHMNRGRYHAGKPADGQTVTAAVQTYNSNVVPATISYSTPLITSKEPVNMITQQQSRN
ncbi:hypothetical protein GH714_033277 [Hevea brasiliensis]|uniref:Growth-regulating factor n=1 Tax=Hevea brasiliensis TaxID=3981 RepID=A0A6A6L693_HEVBR|nr:hypothetical protein GH714_033277 [Hevea brasiliensis]